MNTLLVMSASLIIQFPASQGALVIPQENMYMCERTMKTQAILWRNTEFSCMPNTQLESQGWVPTWYKFRE